MSPCISFLFVLILPFLNFLFLFFHGPFFYAKNVVFKRLFPLVSVFNLFLTGVLVFVLFFEQRTSGFLSEIFLGLFYSSHPGSILDYFDFLNTVSLYNTPLVVNFCFLFDAPTIVMLCVVIFISTLVQLFSTEYMASDFLVIRFFMFLNFFTLCMLVLVTAGSFVQLFIGWEGVGLASFFLIGFWFSRKQAVKCAVKAVIVNRVGDCALLFAFAFLSFIFGNTSFSNVFYSLHLDVTSFNSLTLLTFFENYLELNFAAFTNTETSYLSRVFLVFLQSTKFVDLVAILLCVGAFAKSAQFGLHTWLPDAMEGPTPVSALIHAATMVTAGVFLLIRSSPIISLSYTSQALLVTVGGITALFGASTAFAQFDIKKIIAYSTCSQLGYMVVACGLLLFDLSLFHLATHAFFKAGLFMCAGLVIHALNNEQDIRRFGGLIHLLPLTYFAMLLCSLCLGGFPFFAGYFSKDAIIEMSFLFDTVFLFPFILLVLAACFTVAYSVRLFYYVFWRPFYGFRSSLTEVHETPRSVVAVLTLSFISIFLGFLMTKGFYTNFFYFTTLYGNSVSSSVIFGFFEMWDFCENTFDLFFYQSSALFSLVHLFLPLIVLSLLVSVFFWVWGLLTKAYSFSDRFGVPFSYFDIFWRHTFVFFSKAWLVDTFYTKLARLGFFINKKFIFRFIESGIFEFLLSLSIYRLVKYFSGLLQDVQDGRLSKFFETSTLKVCLLFVLSFLILL